MECLPFFKRLAILRSGTKPESPADFCKIAFSQEKQSKRRQSLTEQSCSSSSDDSRTRDILKEHSRLSSVKWSDDQLRRRSTVNCDETSRISAPSSTEYERSSGSYSADRTFDQFTESAIHSTDYSLSNELLVTLTLNDDDFLGISIVGQNNGYGTGTLFVGSITAGGAVERDGRIQPGDIIQSVNGVSLEGMSNKQAVAVLRDAAKYSRKVTLAVISCEDRSVYSESSCIQPIDPFLWLAHNSRVQQRQTQKIHHGIHKKYGSTDTMSSLTSTSLSSSMPSTAVSNRSRLGVRSLHLETPADIVANRLRSFVMQKPKTSKGKISSSSISGQELQDWLFKNVRGFKDKEEVEVYATYLGTSGYITPIKDVLGPRNFSTFRKDELYIIQTRPLSPAIRPTTPAINSLKPHTNLMASF